MTFPRLHVALSVFTVLLVAADGQAVPQIQRLSLRGLQAGAVTTITIDGSDLLPEPRILGPLPLAEQKLQPGATPQRVQIELKLPADARIGFYPFRVANTKGVSNALLVAVDDLPQLPFAPQIDKLPVALHGNVGGSDTVATSFQGKKGHRLVAEVEARRLGADFDPFLELLDARGVPIASAQSKSILGDDTRLEAVLPADGRYTVNLRDLLYRAGNPNQFRLKIGELHYADLAFPLGLRRGTRASIQLLGQIRGDGRVTVDAGGAVEDLPAPLPHAPGVTGAPPTLFVNDLPDVLETADGKLQDVGVPAAIHGRIAKPREEDRYRLLVKPGMQLRVEVLANRAGSPLDGVLALRKEDGSQLAASDDQGDSVDPALNFTVPEKTEAIVVALSDLQGRGGEQFVYRLAASVGPTPDFRLTIFDDRYQVPRNGTAVVRVRAERQGYNGPIRLTLPELPAGVTVAGDTIPAGVTDTLLTVTAPPEAAAAPSVGQIIGESTTPGTKIRRAALGRENAYTRTRPWLRDSVALAITEPNNFRIEWEPGASELLTGLTYSAAVKVTRPPGVSGPVRLSLLTSQIVPRTKDGKQDDLTRALRLEGKPTVAADQTAGTAAVTVPGDLPPLPYDLVLVAELLGADGKQVVAKATAPGRRLRAAVPLSIKLSGPDAAETRAGSGPPGKLRGRLARAAAFARPVTVTLTGLPAKVPAPTVEVPSGQAEFELAFAAPAGTPPGDLAGVKLVANAKTEAGQAVASNAIPVKLKVLPGEPVLTKGALETDAAGWLDLLAYENLKGWKRVPGTPAAANPWTFPIGEPGGSLSCTAAGPETLLYDRDWTDGILHIEWRSKKSDAPAPRGGALIRSSADTKVRHLAQWADGSLAGDTVADGKPQKVQVPAQFTPRTKPAGEWNALEVTCKGKTVTVWLNGAVTAVWEACPVLKGLVGLHVEGGPVEFRNVKFKETH